MKPIKSSFAITACSVFAFTSLTGMVIAADEPVRANFSGTAPNPHPVTVGLEAGTTGFGASASWRFANHFGVRGGFDYFSISHVGAIKGINYDGHLRLMSEPVTLDYYPWMNHSFHASLGIVFNQNQLKGNAAGDLTVNGVLYPAATASLNVKQQLVDPYLSVGGNIYFDTAHHWSLNGELGVFYAGDPKISFSSTAASAADVAGETALIRSYAKDAKFWPVLKIGVTYSF